MEINEKWGYINKKNEIVIEPKFDFAYSFKEGGAHVQINDKYGYLFRST